MEKKTKKLKAAKEKPMKPANNKGTVSAATEENAGQNVVIKKTKNRKRKRHIYNAIRKQIEFYFSDSNLNKDRFMKKLIEDDPFVSLDVFLTFNKIKELTSSVDQLAISLNNSDQLELDETNKKVRRKTALKPDVDVDDRTLYVEALPQNVCHEWMITMFKQFGAVSYVSLPKFSTSRKPKDFGFVEFEKEKSVQKALKTFGGFKGVLSIENTDPAELASIKSYETPVKTEEDDKKQNTAKKRHLETAESKLVPDAKKRKLDDDSTTTTDDEDSSIVAEPSSNSDDSDTEMTDTTKKAKKERRRHRKSAVKKKKQLDMTTDASFYELKILPKKEWKRLRNRYLNLQREKVGELKRKLAKDKQQQLAKENSAANAPISTRKSKQEQRKLHKMKMNFYGAGADEPPMKQANTRLAKNSMAAEQKTANVKYESGVIVQAKFNEPCVYVKDFKANLRQDKSVKYVDVNEGALEAFIRFESSVAAEKFVQKESGSDRMYTVLGGDVETAYWDKIERDRQMKRNKEVVIKKRGREKVAASSAKHTYFAAEDDVEKDA